MYKELAWMTSALLCIHPVMAINYTPDKVIAYKEVAGARDGVSNTLTLEIIFPENHVSSDSVPCVLFFYGGGWKTGNVRQFYPHARYLASRGMVGICAWYRTESSHGAKPFQCLEDAKSAVRAVRAHAQKLGINPDKLAVGGGSAGGHLAAASSLCLDSFNAPNDDRSVSTAANALLLFNPVFDNGPDGYGHERVRDYYETFSPLHNIKAGAPPTIVFLGDQDQHIPVATAEKYKQKMEQFGNRCDLHIYPGRKHGFFNISKSGTDDFILTAAEMDRFLESLGYLKGPPTVQEWARTEL